MLFFVADLAAAEVATFEAFYKESSAIGWLVAGVLAIAAGAFIFFTGGTASPVVAGIGSWIGGAMGLSGAAATNAGLALLGGGSLASGGFGVLGGAAVLTAALSFSTDVVFDYSIGKAVSGYQYHNLTEQSKGMTTLPLPKNTSGPDAYENAVEALRHVDKKQPVHTEGNIEQIRNAARIAERGLNDVSLDADERAKLHSLIGLLSFVSNDYKKASQHANSAIAHAHHQGLRRTLPAFIYAIAGLYEERVSFDRLHKDYFSYSVLAEPDNPLIPLLFAIYEDRLMLRIDQGALKVAVLAKIRDLIMDPRLEKHRIPNGVSLLVRYVSLLKLEQQKIGSITSSSSRTLTDSPKAAMLIADALTNYGQLLVGAKQILGDIEHLSLDKAGKATVTEFQRILPSYVNDQQRLRNLVDEFSARQKARAEDKAAQVDSDETNWPGLMLLTWLGLLALMALRKIRGDSVVRVRIAKGE